MYRMETVQICPGDTCNYFRQIIRTQYQQTCTLHYIFSQFYQTGNTIYFTQILLWCIVYVENGNSFYTWGLHSGHSSGLLISMTNKVRYSLGN